MQARCEHSTGRFYSRVAPSNCLHVGPRASPVHVGDAHEGSYKLPFSDVLTKNSWNLPFILRIFFFRSNRLDSRQLEAPP